MQGQARPLAMFPASDEWWDEMGGRLQGAGRFCTQQGQAGRPS